MRVYRTIEDRARRRTVAGEEELPPVRGVKVSDSVVSGEDAMFRVLTRDEAFEALLE